MQYIIQLLEDSQIINVTIHGKWEAVTDKAMALDIMAKVVEWRVNRVLIDMRELQFDLPMIDLFQRAKELREQRRSYKLVNGRVALVYQPTDKKLDDNVIFFENTAQNRGLPYRVFKDLELALAWLKE